MAGDKKAAILTQQVHVVIMTSNCRHVLAGEKQVVNAIDSSPEPLGTIS